MGSLYLLIPVSLIFCVLALAVFFWAVNNGQYDDLDGEGERLLFDQSDKKKGSKPEKDPSDTDLASAASAGAERSDSQSVIDKQ